MKTLYRLMIAVTVSTMLVGGCSTNPVTGRRQLVLISRTDEIAIGQDAAPQFEDEFGGKVPHSGYEILPVLAFSNQHLDISIHFFKRLV